ncbi:MAG: spore coat protein CotJB [Oscillospiraceae bacterium]
MGSNLNNMSNMNNMNNRRPSPQQKMQRNTANGCEELMRAIMEADFFAQDLKLYLDTHPGDMRAVEMFREACRQYKACKAAFEDSFYPLTACSAGAEGKWNWPEGNFPPKS